MSALSHTKGDTVIDGCDHGHRSWPQMVARQGPIKILWGVMVSRALFVLVW
jgi:hypothetical protein